MSMPLLWRKMSATSTLFSAMAFGSSTAASSFQRPFLLVALGQMVLLLVQSVVLWPLTQNDPLTAHPPQQVSVGQAFWTLRGIAIATAPLFLALRVFGLAVVLHAVLSLWSGRRGGWWPLCRRLVCAEGIFLLESACAVLLLLGHAPATWEEATQLRLRAGLDLFWQPGSAALAAWIASANFFVLWWTDRVRAAARDGYGLSAIAACGVAAVFGLLLVVVRYLSMQF